MKIFVAVAVLVAMFAFASASTEEIEQGPIQCAVCQFVVTQAENFVQKNETQDQLKSLLGKICSKAKLSDWCQKNLFPILNTLLQSIVQKTNPGQVCSKIKMCNASQVVSELDIASELVIRDDMPDQEKDSIKCSVCEAIIQYVENNLSGPANQDKIQALITQACSKIKFATQVCANIIAPTVAQIVNAIAQKLTPPQVCQAIKFCSQ